jgi:hypothetical protein
MSLDFGRPSLPMAVPLDQQRFNEWAYNAIQNLVAALIPPSNVSNLRCTPQPGGNLIDFTRSDGDTYTLYINTTASIDGAERVQLGASNRFAHTVGIASVKYYYAVKAKKGVVNGEVSEWVSGTTLALTTPAAAVDPPPATEFPFQDQENDSVEIAVPSAQDYFPV